MVTRGEPNRALVRSLGVSWVGGAMDRPAGELVPVALAALDRGGTLALAGVHLSDVPGLDYQRHLFLERNLRSVTANTRRDGKELLALAARLRIRPHVDQALLDLAEGGPAAR